MNGSTNVQMSGIAIFVSLVTLWLADFFFPDLMATAPEMLGEAFVGFLVIVFGLLFKADAGIKQLPGTGDARSPAFVGLLAILLACFALSGCGTQRPQIDSISDAIAVTAADVETAAQTVKSLCRNERPGGPCAAGAPISTDQKESLKNGLQDVLDGLSLANLAVATGNDAEARGGLARTEAILAVLRAELIRLQN